MTSQSTHTAGSASPLDSPQNHADQAATDTVERTRELLRENGYRDLDARETVLMHAFYMASQPVSPPTVKDKEKK
jgi:hypothetical protein